VPVSTIACPVKAPYRLIRTVKFAITYLENTMINFRSVTLASLRSISLAAMLAVGLTACSNPSPGPDKTVAGAVLGAGWGAGAGAVVGHQVGRAGEGAAIGSGFGLVSGAISGLGYDIVEDTQVRQESELAALKVQNRANGKQIEGLQASLDRSIGSDMAGGVHQVFFDVDATSLKSGAIANLEVIAEAIKGSTHGYWINVGGHSDDSGNPEYNSRLAEARARSVSAYLAARGLSSDRIKVQSFGSTRPIASNSTPVGRQLNRRVDIYISRK
jgi:outer membrane protein OmpA-like peptidoglycan-associated protein